MAQGRLSGAGGRISMDAAAAGLVLAGQAGSWSLMASPLAGGGTHPDPVLLAVISALVAVGAVIATRAAVLQRLPVMALSLGAALSGSLGLALGGTLLAATLGGGARWLVMSVLAAALVLGPASILAGALLSQRRAAAIGFWLGLATGTAAVGLLASTLPAWVWLVVLPLGLSLWAWGFSPPAATSDTATAARSSVWSSLVLVLATAVWILAVLAAVRFLLLVCGTFAMVRTILLLSALVGLAAGGWLCRRWLPGESSLPLALSAVLALSGIGLYVSVLLPAPVAAVFVRLAGSGPVPATLATVCLAALVLLPLTVLGGTGLGWLCRWHGRESAATVAWLGAAGALAVAVESSILVTLLGPARLLTFGAAALPLGVALPAALGAIGPVPLRRRLLVGGALPVLAVGILAMAPPVPRLLAAGIGWSPASFQGPRGPVVAENLGRTRLLGQVPATSGLVTLRQISGEPARLVWQGRALASLGPEARRAELTIGMLATLLHPSPEGVVILGVDGGGIEAGVQAVAPAATLHTRHLVPGLERLRLPDENTTAPPAEIAAGFTPDVLILRPPPADAAGGIAWSVQMLRHLATELHEDGLLALAVDPASLSHIAFRRIVATFTRVFPEASLWFDGQGVVLVGGRLSLSLSLSQWERRFRDASPHLHDTGLSRPVDLLARFIMPAAGLAGLASGVPPERLSRPAIAFDPQPTASSGGLAILGRLAVVPEGVMSLFPSLEGSEQTAFNEALLPASGATAHLLAALGLAPTSPLAAIEQAEQVVELRPEDALAHSTLGNLCYRAIPGAMEANDIEAALRWAEMAAHHNPGRVDHHLVLYDILMRLGRSTAARRVLGNLSLRFPRSYPVLLLLAQQRLDQGDINAAEAFLRRAADERYETADLALGLARVFFARQQPAPGRRMVARAMRLTSEPAAALAYIGGRLLATDNGVLAEQYLLQARDLGRDEADVWGPLGELAMSRKDYQTAIGHLSHAVDADPHSVRIRLNLGTSLLLERRGAEAIPHLQHAAQMAPDDPMVHLNLAMAFFREGDRAAARAHLSQVGQRLAGNPILERLRQDLGVGEAEEPPTR